MGPIDFVQRIIDFCKENHITAEIVNEKAGITKAHFYNVRNRKGPQITMPFLVRFCRGLREYNAEEKILAGVPLYSEYALSDQTDEHALIYDFDLAAYSYFSYGRKILTNRKSSFPHLISFLGFLTSVYSFIGDQNYGYSYAGETYPYSYNDFLEATADLEGKKSTENAALILPVYNALFAALRNQEDNLSYNQPRATIYQFFDSFYQNYAMYPEVITWTDIADCVSWFRYNHHLSNVQMDKEAGVTQGLSGRFEYQQSKIYRCVDVLTIGQLFGEDYRFFALCYRATLTTLLLESMYDFSSEEKENKVTAISLFIRMMRCIQAINPSAANFVLSELRSFFNSNSTYSEEYLSLVNKNKQFLYDIVQESFYKHKESTI